MPADGRTTHLWPALVGAAAAAVHLAVALRGDRFVATVGEARMAAAAFAARGAELGDITLPAADRFAVRQLAAVETLLPTGDLPVVDAARSAALAFGFVSVVLLWPVLRALGARPVPAAVATGLIGVLPPVVVLHAGITAAAPATVWLVAAALLAGSARRRIGWAAAAAGLAALTAPLAAVALLGLAAHLLHDRVVGGHLPPAARRALTVGTGAAAVAVAAAAAGNGPLAGVGGPVVGFGTTVAMVATGVALSGLAWTQHPELRPALTPALLLLAVALVPGAARSAALLLVLPFLAVVFALLAGPVVAALPEHRPVVPGERPVGPSRGAAVFAPLSLATLALAAVVGLLAVVNAPPVPPSGLAGWVRTEIDRDVVLRADPLDRAELVAHGIAADRLRDLAEPARPGELMVVTDRPTTRSADAPRCAPTATLAMVPRGSGGAPTSVCPATPLAAETAVSEQAARARFGAALARNPSLALQPEAAAALQAGLVDPRLVLVLADLASPRRLAVDAFPVEPLEPPSALRRHVLLSAVDGLPAADGRRSPVRTWFAAQQPPLVPNSIEVRGEALLIGYPAPTPTGLIAG
jgi:hypothetical protein